MIIDVDWNVELQSNHLGYELLAKLSIQVEKSKKNELNFGSL